jgi:hypothetical protein
MWSLLLNGYSTILNCLEFPKQPNCCETEATEDATVREGVCYSRRKHCIWGATDRTDSQHPCGGGVEYLHRDPASRRRRRKGKSQICDSKIRSQVPKGLGPEKGCGALARASGTYKRQTRPLVREGAPRKQERNCQTEINIWGSIPRLTDWLTVSRNVTLTLTDSQRKTRDRRDTEIKTLKRDHRTDRREEIKGPLRDTTSEGHNPLQTEIVVTSRK